MSLQVNIFLLLFGGLQGLLLTLFLVRKKLHRHGYIYLLLFFGIMLLQVTLKVMSKVWLMQHWDILYDISYYLPYLYGPLAFLFVRQLLLQKKFHPAELFHFLPFVFIACFSIIEEVLPGNVGNLFYNRENGFILQLISLMAYHGLAQRAWLEYRDSLKAYYSEVQRLQLSWVKQFISGSFMLCCLIASAIYLLYINNPNGANFRYGFVALTVFIYWVSYTALAHPNVFSVIRGNAVADPALIPLPKLVVHRPVKKYSNSSLDVQTKELIRAALTRLMQEQKPYLRPELTINELSSLISCNRHHLSQVLNDSMEKSFYDYINLFRVDEAKQLLLDPSKENHKIASIAYDAGFNSLSTFNEVFKKITGLSPSQFRKAESNLSKQQSG